MEWSCCYPFFSCATMGESTRMAYSAHTLRDLMLLAVLRRGRGRVKRCIYIRQVSSATECRPGMLQLEPQEPSSRASEKLDQPRSSLCSLHYCRNMKDATLASSSRIHPGGRLAATRRKSNQRRMPIKSQSRQRFPWSEVAWSITVLVIL